jgi:hypothetical protein
MLDAGNKKKIRAVDEKQYIPLVRKEYSRMFRGGFRDHQQEEQTEQ